MKNSIVTLFIVAYFAFTANTQVPLTTIVEHFTNTKCSICASKNPGFYTNLNSNTAVLHLSVHPSAPYTTCPLSQQNTVDNDARTNYYGIYGGTPRLVINGDVISTSTNYSSSSIFTPYQGLTSSFSLQASQVLVGSDSIRSIVVIKKVAASSLTTGSVFIGLAEDTIFLNGGNGETQHFNVLRKAASSSGGIAVILPSPVNDSIIVSRTSFINPIWNQSRMFTMGILQDAGTKDVIQSGKSVLLNAASTGIGELSADIKFQVYPNPAGDFINITIAEKGMFVFEIVDLAGKLVKQGTTEGVSAINVSSFENGFYAIHLYNSEKNFKNSFSVQK